MKTPYTSAAHDYAPRRGITLTTRSKVIAAIGGMAAAGFLGNHLPVPGAHAEGPQQVRDYLTQPGDTDQSVGMAAFPHTDPRLSQNVVDHAADKAVGQDLPLGTLPSGIQLELPADAQIGHLAEPHTEIQGK